MAIGAADVSSARSRKSSATLQHPHATVVGVTGAAGLMIAEPATLGPPVAVEPVGLRGAGRRRWKVALRYALTAGVSLLVVRLLVPPLQLAARHWSSLRSPGWTWIAVLALAGLATHVMGAVALSASTFQRLRFASTVWLQFAAGLANRLAPSGLGAMLTSGRYLRRCGSDTPAAAASVGLVSTAGFVVHLVATTLVLALVAPTLLTRWHPPGYWPVVVAGVAATVAAAALVISSSRFAAPLRRGIRAGVASLRQVLSRPRRCLALFSGSAGVTLFYIVALAASFQAFHVHIGLLDISAVYLGASAVAAGSPTPSGMGATEAALITAATALVGQTAGVVDAVLAFRLVTYWLPSLPGIAAMAHLRRRALL
jgi:uncharacterized membrane protein YbhN (UPF0104 family)